MVCCLMVLFYMSLHIPADWWVSPPFSPPPPLSSRHPWVMNKQGVVCPLLQINQKLTEIVFSFCLCTFSNDILPPFHTFNCTTYMFHFILYMLYFYIINHICLRDKAINQVYYDVCILSLGQFGTKLIGTGCKMNV